MENKDLTPEQIRQRVLEATIDSAKLGVYMKVLGAFKNADTLEITFRRVMELYEKDFPESVQGSA